MMSPQRPYAIWVAFYLLFVALPDLSHAISEVPEPVNGTSFLEEAETLVYSRTGTDRAIFRLLDRAADRFRAITDVQTREYWLARVELLRAIRYNQFERSRDAEPAISAGFDHIEHALEYGVFSDGLRVRADLHSQMMLAKGLIYMIRNGNEARDAALDALERAPRSVKAKISVAGFLLNAPPMAGGDPEQARLVLESALAEEPVSDNDRFLILGWLAQASHTLDDDEAAEQYYAEALAMYPESEWLASIGEEITE